MSFYTSNSARLDTSLFPPVPDNLSSGHSEEAFPSWLTDHGYCLGTYHHDRHALAFGRHFSAADFDLFAFSLTRVEFVFQ